MAVKAGDDRVMYCAIPTRMRSFSEEAKAIARKAGYSPVVSFDALSYEDSEGGPLSRERSLRFGIDLIKCCYVLGIFGISPGVMGELRDALSRWIEVRTFYGHDPEWDKEYEALRVKHGDLFAELRGPHSLVALVGPSAIGKTYWSQRLREFFGQRLGLVKNTTTRCPRNTEDLESYYFVSREDFERGIGEKMFLEHDEYLGSYYGSSMNSIRDTLNTRNGIFAITPSGAAALYERRFEVNFSIILLKPANEGVMLKNLLRRGITDTAEQAKLIAESGKFWLLPEIEHQTITITGTSEDEFKIISAVEAILNKPR